jgi:hypothetical protein
MQRSRQASLRETKFGESLGEFAELELESRYLS